MDAFDVIPATSGRSDQNRPDVTGESSVLDPSDEDGSRMTLIASFRTLQSDNP